MAQVNNGTKKVIIFAVDLCEKKHRTGEIKKIQINNDFFEILSEQAKDKKSLVCLNGKQVVPQVYEKILACGNNLCEAKSKKDKDLDNLISLLNKGFVVFVLNNNKAFRFARAVKSMLIDFKIYANIPLRVYENGSRRYTVVPKVVDGWKLHSLRWQQNSK
ncbi:MAG: hypothetical protein QY321_04015 [Patescibacteria group bacterium]|nr:MAG: hypothetical protein QY321_04015 [Patescibacteria group bacterium]